MDSTIKQQWINRLTDPNYVQATGYLHVQGGAFDALGLLCDIYFQAFYTMPAGSAVNATAMLNYIKDTRQVVTDKITEAGGKVFTPNTHLEDTIRDAYNSDILDPADKIIIKNCWDNIRKEQIEIDALGGAFPVEIGYYDTAIAQYELFLASLSDPGGWDKVNHVWRTDYTSKDTTSFWINSGNYFTIAGFNDKLPEAVQRWAQIKISDPILLVSDAYGFNGVTYPFFLNKLNDGNIQKNDNGVKRPYTPTELADMIRQQF